MGNKNGSQDPSNPDEFLDNSYTSQNLRKSQ